MELGFYYFTRKKGCRIKTTRVDVAQKIKIINYA